MLIRLTTLFLQKLHVSNIFFYLNAFIVLIVCCLIQLFISRHIVVGFNFVRDVIFFSYYLYSVIIFFSRTKLQGLFVKSNLFVTKGLVLSSN